MTREIKYTTTQGPTSSGVGTADLPNMCWASVPASWVLAHPANVARVAALTGASGAHIRRHAEKGHAVPIAPGGPRSPIASRVRAFQEDGLPAVLIEPPPWRSALWLLYATAAVLGVTGLATMAMVGSLLLGGVALVLAAAAGAGARTLQQRMAQQTDAYRTAALWWDASQRHPLPDHLKQRLNEVRAQVLSLDLPDMVALDVFPALEKLERSHVDEQAVLQQLDALIDLVRAPASADVDAGGAREAKDALRSLAAWKQSEREFGP